MTISKDLVSGLLFLAVGAFLVVEAADYRMGTLLRMGPGYFPVIIGSLILLVGGTLTVKGVMKGAEKLPTFSLRPLVFLLGAILAFALALERTGLIAATILLVLIGRMASQRPMNWKASALLCAVLVGAAVLIFWYLLELPMKLWP